MIEKVEQLSIYATDKSIGWLSKRAISLINKQLQNQYNKKFERLPGYIYL